VPDHQVVEGHARVHPGVQVVDAPQVRRIGLAVVTHRVAEDQRSRPVGAPDMVGGQAEIAAPGALVAQAPDQKRGVVLVALGHFSDLGEEITGPARVVLRGRQALVDFVERCVNLDIKPEPVAQVEQLTLRRTSDRADEVDMRGFKQAQILGQQVW